MNQLPENSLCTHDITLVTSYLIGLGYNRPIIWKPAPKDMFHNYQGQDQRQCNSFIIIKVKIKGYVIV